MYEILDILFTGDKLKVEEKLQVLDALISVCEQKPDLIVNCHPGTNSNTNELHHKSQARGKWFIRFVGCPSTSLLLRVLNS